jgi:hypothetical protein
MALMTIAAAPDWIDLLVYPLLATAVLAFAGLTGMVGIFLVRDALKHAPVAGRGDNGHGDHGAGTTAPRKPTPPVMTGNAASPLPADEDVPRRS